MGTSSRFVDGALVYYAKGGSGHLRRFLDAIGQNVVKYITDFTTLPVDDTTGDPTEFTLTVVEVGTGASTLTQADGSGGIARITTAANDNDGANAQLNGESFQLKSTNKLYAGFFGVTISDVTQSDFFLGLAITDTDILGGVTDRIGFQSVDASAALTFPIEKDSTETNFSTGITLVDATSVDLEFYWDGNALEVFVDGVSVGNPAVTNVPSDEALRVTWQFLNGAAGAETMDVDAIRIIQIGR